MRARIRLLSLTLSLLSLLFLLACGGGGDSPPPPPPPPPIPAPTAAPVVAYDMEAGTLTATWTVETDASYNLYYAAGSPTATPGKLNATALTASPATVSLTGPSGVLYFWLTRVTNAGESAASPNVYLYGWGTTALTLDTQGATPSFTASTTGVVAAWELHRLPSGTATPTPGTAVQTLVSTNTFESGLFDTLTTFVDAAGVPLTYEYGAVASNVGSDGVSTSRSAVARVSYTPSLDAFEMLAAGNRSTVTRGSTTAPQGVVLTATQAYWICQSRVGICRSDLGVNVATAPTIWNLSPPVPGTGNYGLALVVDTVPAAPVVYSIHFGSNGGVVRLNTSNGSTSFVTVNNPTAIVQDANFVYVANYSGVQRIPKVLANFIPANLTPVNATAMVAGAALALDGTTLYVGTGTGVEILAGVNGALPVTQTTLVATTAPVTELALDTVGGKLYYLAPSIAYPGAAAIHAWNIVGGTDAVAVDPAFGASHLASAAPYLVWESTLYSYRLDTGTSALQRFPLSGGALAANSADGSLLLLTSLSFPAYLPASYGWTPTAAGTISQTAVTPGDQSVTVDWDATAAAAEGYELVANTAATTTYINAAATATVTGLPNTTPETITVTPLALVAPTGNAGPGTGFTTPATTPVMGAPFSPIVREGLSQVTVYPRTNHPVVRPYTLNLYVGNTQPVDTSGTTPPVATYNDPVGFAPATSGTLVHNPAANGTNFYYNVVAVEDATGSTSAPMFTPGTEGRYNAAAAAEAREATTGPTGPRTSGMMANVGDWLYWTDGNILSSALYRQDTAAGTPATETLALPVIDTLGSDGIQLFGADANIVYEITTPTGTPSATLILGAADPNLATASFISSIYVEPGVGGKLYLGTHTGKILSMARDGVGGTTLLKDIIGGAVCDLSLFGGNLYWRQAAVGDVLDGCGATIVTAQVKTMPATAGAAVSNLVNYAAGVFAIQPAQIGADAYLYYSSANGIQRIDLTTAVTDTPLTSFVPQSGMFAISALGKLYYTNEGNIYRLDGTGTPETFATSAPNASVTRLFLSQPAGAKLYLFGGGKLFQTISP